jgi:NAD(P)-dependent dehydrogenase (short-subunit alcohol dehydrogenase family)
LTRSDSPAFFEIVSADGFHHSLREDDRAGQPRDEQAMFTRDLPSGKHILVTGGGTGLGKSMSRRFLELGVSVLICGRRQNLLEETATQFAKEFPQRIAWHVCDIRNATQVEAVVETIWAAQPLDALVNNAAGNFIAVPKR